MLVLIGAVAWGNPLQGLWQVPLKPRLELDGRDRGGRPDHKHRHESCSQVRLQKRPLNAGTDVEHVALTGCLIAQLGGTDHLTTRLPRTLTSVSWSYCWR